MTATQEDNPLHPERLGPVLAEALADPAWRDFRAELIAGGKSNLTYRLTAGGQSVVLRRPPTGKLLPKAHDMARENKVMSTLQGTDIPVPEILHFEDAESSTLGVAFLVMEDVPGTVIRDRVPPRWADADSATALAAHLVDTLAALHRVDPADVGLQDFGRPEGHFERVVRRWRHQIELESDHEIPEVLELGTRLTEHVPPQQRSGIAHGDYRLDNCIFAQGARPSLAAVLDWELSTLGDPLTDFGLLLSYWRQAGEDPWVLAPAPTLTADFPDRGWLVERYAEKSGLDVGRIRDYEALAYFKFAAITHGVAARVARGAMAGQDFGDLSDEVRRIAVAGLDVLENKE